MSVSTDGQICFGIKFEDEFEFPWDKQDDPDADIDDWWMQISGYEHLHGWDPYTDAGEYKPGVDRNDPRYLNYIDHRIQWAKAHPVPVELVNYCSGDCPMYILAVPASCLQCYRGSPKSFAPALHVVSDTDRDKLLAFCQEHGIEPPEAPKWWLSSYWG